jgi:nitrite reductase/ring-hydroxylating ferredoxin subunit
MRIGFADADKCRGTAFPALKRNQQMKTKFYKAISVSDLAEKPMKKVQLAGKDIVVARAGDEYFAFGHRCTHRGGPLAMGELSAPFVTCPWHGGMFDIRSGELQHPPPVEHVASYPVRITDGTIEIGIAEPETV